MKSKENSLSLDSEVFDTLIGFARFELDDSDKTYLFEEINKQLFHLQEMINIDVGNVDPMFYGVEVDDQYELWRDDIVEPCLNLELLVSNFPVVDEQYIVVPVVPHNVID